MKVSNHPHEKTKRNVSLRMDWLAGYNTITEIARMYQISPPRARAILTRIFKVVRKGGANYGKLLREYK